LSAHTYTRNEWDQSDKNVLSNFNLIQIERRVLYIIIQGKLWFLIELIKWRYISQRAWLNCNDTKENLESSYFIYNKKKTNQTNTASAQNYLEKSVLESCE
jgi:hypothetical protein